MECAERSKAKIPKATGLSIAALRPVRVIIDKYDPAREIVMSGSLEAISNSPYSTGIQLKAERLIPGKKYQLFIDQDPVGEKMADKYGTILFTIPVQQDGEKRIQLLSR